jgi:hypothetical protein
MRLVRVFYTVFTLLFLQSLNVYSQEEGRMIQTSIPLMKLEKICMPGRSPAQLNAQVIDDGRAPFGRLLIGTISANIGYLIDYDFETGETHYNPTVPFRTRPDGENLNGSICIWGVAVYDDSTAYAAGTLNASMYKYDLRKRTFSQLAFPFAAKRFVKNELIDGESYIWQLHKATDGKLYGGTWPNGKLISYDPKKGTFEDYGQMVENEQYLIGINGEFPDRIYCGIGAHAQLVEYNTKTKLKKNLFGDRYKSREAFAQLKRVGDLLVALVYPQPVVLIIEPSKGEVLKEVLVPDQDDDFYRTNAKSIVSRGDEIFFGMNPSNKLYKYNVKTDKLTLVGADLGGPIGLVGGRYLYLKTVTERYKIYDLETNKIVKEVQLHVETDDGMIVFAMNFGPDGKVYGGSFINQHLWVFDPATMKCKDLGVAINLGGQVNSMVPYNGKLYIGHYILATVSVYDPTKPWNPTPALSPNPRIIGSVGDEQDRIHDMVVGADGKIYMATYPGKGRRGGSLTILDPETEKMEVHRDIVPLQSLRSLESARSGIIYAGSDKHIGLGNVGEEAKDAHVIGWSVKEKKIVDDFVPLPGARIVWKISEGLDGMLYGSADSTFFVYDPGSRSVVYREDPGWGSLLHLVASKKDGKVYGIAKKGVYMFDPETKEFTLLVQIEAEGWTDYIIENEQGDLYLGIREWLYRLHR